MDASTPGTAASLLTHPKQKAPEFTPEHALAIHMSPVRPCAMRTRALHELLDVLPKQCKVIFVMLPISPQYVGLIDESPQIKDTLQRYRTFLEGLNDPRVSIVWYDDFRTTNLSPDEYTDPIHFTVPVMQTKVSALLADVIRPHLSKDEMKP